MNSKEAFKIGFLQKCAADGLSSEETLHRIQHAKFMLKSGGDPLWQLPFKLPAKVLAAKVLAAFAPFALLTPPLAGMGAGAMLAKAQDDTHSPEEARTLEEVSEYQRAIDGLKRLQAKQQAAMGVM